MPEDNKEYHRIKYSLKMALRMINGNLEDFKVWQFANSSNLLQDDLEKTSIESWYKFEGTP